MLKEQEIPKGNSQNQQSSKLSSEDTSGGGSEKLNIETLKIEKN